MSTTFRSVRDVGAFSEQNPRFRRTMEVRLLDQYLRIVESTNLFVVLISTGRARDY